MSASEEIRKANNQIMLHAKALGTTFDKKEQFVLFKDLLDNYLKVIDGFQAKLEEIKDMIEQKSGN